ncbi:hypothetical protein SISSUDRAFT_1016643 [Sistotremastrum suecicum HHB10207 ss-3]|uniref:Uncharacterized protein n=1 Tax=Sistotremastrum suecicum HHB10207 ss-3 TaxID=1314776 RepID=A0A166GWJ9_9AGAM|nr:hypothetical protein SISSUDRAFT_1016643 [Sistotremastrum suecicum HHB10207 ss-3]
MKAAAHGPTEPDPHAAAFLRHTLGESKWSIFSARLFERRMGASRKKKPRSVLPLGGPYDQSNNGASVVDFLVKVEAVKEILRNFVPHPYHPVKFMVHEFPQAPSGKVTLTRSTVLELSGWSNTQFSYWARRAEAVSVLATDDPRLGAVASALSIRLASPDPSVPQPSELDESEEGDNLLHVTGKGIDAIVEDVKKRTGKSQFLRGKHSGLEPFGTLDSLANGYGDSSQTCDAVQEEPRAPEGRLMPTFQAEMYTHTPPSPAEASTSTISYPVSLSFPPSDPPPTTQFIPELQGRSNTSPSGFPSRPQTRRVTNSRRLQTIPGQTEGDKDNATFPLSDSRFEVDPSNPDVGKRKRTTSAPESSRKRPRGMPIFIPSALTPTHATV